jgi:hypothetical protein
MKSVKSPFRTEADLCAAYLDSLDTAAWVSYPETAGWDILLVRRADGFQIGIQAKQRMGTDVVNQAIEDYHSWAPSRPGPDCRAVLVPSTAGFALICKYLALVLITPTRLVSRTGWRFDPCLPNLPPAQDWADWPEWAPIRRHDLPEYVPDVRAGASGPTQLTDWKIKALKITVLLERHGGVTRADFAHLRLDARRWLEGDWLDLIDGVFVRGERWPGFEKAHPRVYQEIAADFEKWAPKERSVPLPIRLKQGSML